MAAPPDELPSGGPGSAAPPSGGPGSTAPPSGGPGAAAPPSPGDPPLPPRPPSRSIPRPPPPRRDAPAAGDAAAPSGAAPARGGPARGGPEHARPRPADLRPLRYRILPRTAIGISIAVLSFALGASFVGVVLYSYYEYRLTQTQEKVSNLSAGIQSTADKASAQLKSEEASAQALITQQIAPLRSVLATGQTLQNIVAKTAPSLYFVHTLDSNGQPSVGTAFAVASDTRQTLLLTSYTVVQAATRKPGPALYVRHGTTDTQVTVYTWEEDKDLALIILPLANQPKLAFASNPPALGERVFALSGLGAAGASITQGFVADVSAEGIQHDARIGTQFQGGPMLNSDGQVVGILSRTYSPLGFQVADVYFAVPPAAACDKVLSCPGGTPAQSGSQNGQ